MGAGDLVLPEVPRKWPEPCKDQLCLTPAPSHKWKLRRRNKTQQSESLSVQPVLIPNSQSNASSICQPSTWEVKAKGCGIWGQLLLHSEFKASFD